MRWTLKKKGMLIVVLPLACQLVFVLVLIGLLREAEQDMWREAHTSAVLSRTNSVISLVHRLASSLFMYTVTMSQQSQAQFNRLMQEVPQEIDSLRVLLQEGPHAKEDIETMERLSESLLSYFTQAKRMADDKRMGGFFGMRSFRDQTRVLSEKHLPELQRFFQKQRRLALADPQTRSRSRENVIFWLVFGVAVTLVAAVGAALLYTRNVVNRLQTIVDNAHHLSESRPLSPPLAGTDEIAYLDQVFHDMAAKLAESARKERAIFDNAVDVIFSLKENLMFQQINHACLNAWGYAASDLTGSPLLQVVPPEKMDSVKRTLENVKGSGASSQSFEAAICHQDGHPVDSLWSVIWSEAEQSFFCVAHDLSERKKAERLKQELIAMISHDLRTPLTSMRCGLGSVIDGAYGNVGAEAREQLRVVDKNAVRLLSLVTEILDLEKAGKVELACEEVPLRPIILRAVRVLAQFAQQKQIEIHHKDIDIDVFADEVRLEQVVTNLLSNAIKFSPPGSSVIVESKLGDDAVVVCVRDRGPGVAGEHRDLVFERFQQAPGHESSSGSGLGLFICKSIIEAHGGKIAVEDNEGDGSTFWFSLPRQPLARS